MSSVDYRVPELEEALGEKISSGQLKPDKGVTSMFKAFTVILMVGLSGFAFSFQDDTDFSEMSLEDLLNVEVVSAGKTAQKISDIASSAVLITRQEIERYGYQTLDEVLKNVTGLYGIDQRANGGTFYGIRGFGPQPQIVLFCW